MKIGLLTIFRSSERNIFKSILAIGLIAGLLIGCGGSSSSSTDDDKGNKGDKKKLYAKSIQYTVASLGNQSKDVGKMKKRQKSASNSIKNIGQGSALEVMTDADRDTSDAVADWQDLSNTLSEFFSTDFSGIENEFGCGTGSHSVSADDGSVTLTLEFDGSCVGVTGSLAMVISAGKGVRMKIDNFSADNCVTNGEIAIKLDLVSGPAKGGTIRIEFNKFSMCDEEELTASYDMTYDGAGNVSYKLGDMKYSYVEDGEDIVVSTDGIAVDGNGVTNGKITVKAGEETSETVTLKDVAVDDACGVPTSGILTIDNPKSDPVVVDFADTTCDNPVVKYVVDGIEHSLTLNIDGNVPESKTPSDGSDGDKDEDKAKAVDMSGRWVGTATIRNEAPKQLELVNISSAEDGDSTSIEEAEIRIHTEDGSDDMLEDDSVTGSVKDSNVSLKAKFNEDLTDPLNQSAVYIFTGTVKAHTYSGDIEIDGVKKSGTFSISLVEGDIGIEW